MEKGIKDKNSMIELGKCKTHTQFVDTPSYEHIFRPPKAIDFDPSKLYGRMLLKIIMKTNIKYFQQTIARFEAGLKMWQWGT